jgi:hypothetical protein
LQTKVLRLRRTGGDVGEARRDLLGRGFTVVQTPPLNDDGLLVRLKRRRTVLPFHCPRWWKYPSLARHGLWLEQWLDEVLPREDLCLAYLEFRREPADSVDPEADRLHIDGSYLRSVCTLFGPTTVYRDGDVERSTPCGQTLLLTARDRARALGVPCTLHRRPGPGPERAVIVCSFEPRREQPPLANLYRRVALAASPPRRA